MLLGLDVTVHETVLVRARQSLRHVTRDPQGVFERQLPFPQEPFAQGLAFDVRRDQVPAPVELTRVDERQDVRVTQLRDRGDLTLEPGPQVVVGGLGAQDLDRDGPPVLQVGAQKDPGHRALAEQLLDGVPALERRREEFQLVRHRLRSREETPVDGRTDPRLTCIVPPPWQSLR